MFQVSLIVLLQSRQHSIYALGRKRLQYIVNFLNENDYFGRDWYLLGLYLQITPGRLDVIRQGCGLDCEQCLILCLLYWLNQQDGIAKKEGALKWKHYKALSEALKRIHEVAIAEKLEQQCECMSCCLVLTLSKYINDALEN